MSKSVKARRTAVTIPSTLAADVRKKTGRKNISAFVARALRHELERESLGDFLADLEARLGPVDADAMAEARAIWLDS